MWPFIAVFSNIYVFGQNCEKNSIIKQFQTFFMYLSPLFVYPPTHTGPKLMLGSRGKSVEVFSFNAGTQYLGKAQNVKIICIQLNRIPAQNIQ